MPITTNTIDLLLRGVRAEFIKVTDQAEKQTSAYDANVYLDATNHTGGLFEEVSAVGQQRVEFTSVTGVSELSPTKELQPFVEATYTPSYITSVEPYKFTKRIKVSQESAERRDSKYQKALNEASKLNYAFMNTRAKHRFELLNNATTAQASLPVQLFGFGDALPLASAAHTLKNGLTYSNVVTAADITGTSIEAMVLVLQSQTDDIGEPMPMGGGTNYLIVPPKKVKKAKENIDSEWQVGTANNTINVWKTVGWILVSSPFLQAAYGGSDTAWHVVDGMFSPFKDVTFKSVENTTWYDEDTKAFVHDIQFQHKVGPEDWRGYVYNAGL